MIHTVNNVTQITANEIEALATTKEVKTVAVMNFLCTTRLRLSTQAQHEGVTHGEATANLTREAKMYKWNDATVKAIKKGLALMLARA